MDDVNKIVDKLKEDKLASEANIVGLLFKNPELFNDCDSLSPNDFSNNAWRIYFEIAKKVYGQGKNVLDDITIGLFVSKHERLKAFYRFCERENPLFQ